MTAGWEAAHGKARTSKIQSMFVTLDVSKLTGWLNVYAPCRGSQAGRTRCGASCGPGGGRRRAIAVRAACSGGHDCRLGAQGAGRCALRTCGTCS